MLTLRLPALADPETGERLIETQAVEVRVSPASVWEAWRGRSATIAIPQITIAGPVEIEFARSADGELGPSPALARIRDLFHAASSARGSGGGGGATGRVVVPARPLDFALGKIDVADARVALRSDEDYAADVRDADVLVEFGAGPTPRKIVAVGSLAGPGGACGFNLRLEPRPGRDEVKVDLRTLAFDSDSHLPGGSPWRVRTSGAHMEGTMRRDGEGVWSFASETIAPSLELTPPPPEGGEATPQEFRRVELYATLEWNSGARALRLDVGRFASLDGDLTGSAELALAEPRPYRIRLDPLRLRSESLALLERNLFPKEYLAEGGEESIEIRGEIAGRLDEDDSIVTALDFAADGVTLALPSLPDPVREIAFRGSMTRDNLTIAEATGVVEGLPIRLSGSLRGRALRGEFERLDLAWSTAGEVERLSELLAERGKGAATKFQFRGGVSGSGTISLAEPTRGSLAEMIERANLAGELLFDGAEIRHADLTEPVRELSGRLQVENGEATLRGMSGRIGDVAFSAEGVLRGKRRFWLDPVGDVSVRAAVRAEDGPKYWGWFGREAPEDWPDAKGNGLATIAIRGPLERPRELDFDAGLRFSDIEWNLGSLGNKHLAGTLRATGVSAKVSPKLVEIAPAEAVWGEARARLSGRFAPEGGRIDLALEGKPVALKAILPEGLQRFDVGGGPARVDATVDIALREGAEAPRDLTRIFERAEGDESKTAGERLKATYAAKLAGEASFDGSEFTYDLFPTRVTDFRGRVRFDADRVWTEEPLALKAGERAERTTLAGSFTFPKSETDAFVIDMSLRGRYLNLDDWIREWRRPDPALLNPNAPKHRDNPRWVVRLEARTERTTYRGMDGTDLSGSVSFRYHTRDRGYLTFEDVRAKLGKGSARVDARWIDEPGRTSRRYDIEAEGLDLPPLLDTFFDVDERSGISSGIVTGKLSLEREGPPGTPMTGGGNFRIRESRFVSNAIFGGLGRLTGLEEIFEDVSFPNVEGAFAVENDRVVVEGPGGIAFENPALLHPLSLKVTGALGPARALDLTIGMRFLPRVGDIPVVGRVWNVVNNLTGAVLQYRVTGTLEKPNFTVLPKALTGESP